MYADYEFYLASFGGRLIPSEEFEQLSSKAQRYLDYVTQYRITEPTERIRSAVCAAAEALYEIKTKYGNIPFGVKSENTDGYSVTFSDMNTVDYQKLQREAMLTAIVQELGGTGLLYQE